MAISLSHTVKFRIMIIKLDYLCFILDQAMGKLIVILCVLSEFVSGQYYEIPWRPLYCPFNQDNLIGSNLSDQYRLEYVSVGEYLKIPCCQKFYINVTKQFYHRDRFFTNEEKPLIQTQSEPVWHVRNIREEYTGAYYCKDDFAATTAFTFVYLIDVDFPNVTTIRGKLDSYQYYKDTYLNPLNDYLSNANVPELRDLREKTGLGLEAGMRWDPWTDCNFCAGEKSRTGRCHFYPVVVDQLRWSQCEGLCELYKNALHMDCRSYWTVSKLFPQLADMTKFTPNFQALAKCVGTCNTDAIVGFDYVKKLRTRVLNVGDSAVLSCPGYTKKSNCYWRKNGIKLTPNEYDPFRPVSVNELCMLYLYKATKKTANGNFTCYINDVMIQQNKVIVDDIYQEQGKAWWRHVTYLLYVILLCFIIIVGGIAIGCLQKGNFQDVTADEMIEMYSTQKMEYEKLLPTE